MKKIFFMIMLVLSCRQSHASQINNPSLTVIPSSFTVSTITVTGQINSTDGSANSPSYSFTSSTGTGFSLNGSSVAVLSIQGAPLISWTTGPAFSPTNSSGRVYIGGYPVPDAATADRLTVYTNTNGLGSTNIESADVQVLNEGSGSARFVAYASQATTPSVNIIGTWGSVKSGTYWSGGPVLANSSFIEAQGAANLVFWQGTDSSKDTYFFNQNSSPTFSFHGGPSGNEYLAIDKSSTTIDNPLVISPASGLVRSALQVTSDWTNKTANFNNTSGRGATLAFQSNGADKVTVGIEGSYLGNTSMNGILAAAASNIDFYVNNNSTTTMVLGDSTQINAPLSMGTHKITSLSAATTAGDAVRYEQWHVAANVVYASTNTASALPTSFADVSGLSVAIVPSASTSKVLVRACLNVAMFPASGSTQNCNMEITDGSNTVLQLNQAFAGGGGGTLASESFQGTYCIDYLDSPGSTSSKTYKIRAALSSGSTGPGTGTINYAGNGGGGNSTFSSLLAQEIPQ